ncbi:hypothetical protein DV735_g1862, partial [Chaetothyriales sp. CBS 134920]
MASHRKKRKLSDGAPQVVSEPSKPSNDDDGDQTSDQRRSLFVRSLPASVTSEKLAAHFSDSYPIKHAVVVQDPKTKISRGFGFVTFTDAEDAHAAAEQFNNSTLDNRKIKVEVAQARHRDIEAGTKKGENLTAAKLKAEREKQKEDGQPPRLIVRNLPWSISTAEDLTKLFQSYGKIKHAIVPKRSAGSQYGFGIVIIRGKKNAQKALEQVNGKVIDGRTLAVDWAVDKDTWQQLQQQELQNAAAVDQEDQETGSQDSGDDEAKLVEHFRQFGPVRYARVVYDPETDRSRGTAFVCFFNESDAKACVKDSPKKSVPVPDSKGDKKRRGEVLTHSVLQNEAEDPSGRYTLDSRVLQVSKALSKEDADQRTAESAEKRLKRDGDKRRLYLLSEGTIPASSPLYAKLGKAELDIRQSSAKQRQKLIKANPNLCLSLTRLSIRNLPRHVTSKDLKDLARKAVVGFATDVKAGLREPLSKEELKRGGEEMREAERARKQKGVGVVRQAKIVFEGKEGGKVKEGLGGRSRGYGFVEYHTHRSALSALRWLNGHEIEGKDGERKKRLVVEFAIEDARVVMRRSAREHSGAGAAKSKPGRPKRQGEGESNDDDRNNKKGTKRKRRDTDSQAPAGEKQKKSSAPTAAKEVQVELDEEEKNRIAKRNRIISKKRQQRRNRKA